jgi:hypothetical protein
MRSSSSETRVPATRFHSEHLSIGVSGDKYLQVSFGNAAAGADDVNPAGHDGQYLVVQRQFEDDNGDDCHIETHDHDTYTDNFRLRLLEFTPTHLALEIVSLGHNYVEVSYDLDAKRFIECSASCTDDMPRTFAEAKPNDFARVAGH